MGRCGAAPSVGAAGTGGVVEVWVVATAVVRELVAVEVERVDEVAVSVPSASAGGGCQEAALQQVIHVTSKRGLGQINDSEAEQRGVEPRQVKRQRPRLPRGRQRHDAPERGGERGCGDKHVF
jgi:hypothetical protein